MPCFSPLTAFYSQDVGKSGKRGITFDRNASFSGVKLSLPCQQCVGCRLEYSRQWAIRCMHEKQMHADNVFLTLTYEKVPEGNTLVKEDMVLFLKRLREHVWRKEKRKFRFYMCGEYGETTMRPHYHVILFGYDFPDKKFYKRGKRPGEVLYTSEFCRSVWPFGHNVLGDVTFESAAYVARYCLKKVKGPDAWQAYQWVDQFGVIHDRVPEYLNMSRMPGIGDAWFKKYGSHSYAHDSVIMNGKAVRPPKFYDGRFEVLDAAELARLKSVRRRKALLHRADNAVDRRQVSEAVALARLNLYKRNVE